MKEHNRLHMSERPAATGDYFGLEKRDLLTELSSNDAWDEITIANCSLETATVGQKSDVEDEALSSVADCLAIATLQQPVNVIGEAYRHSSGELPDKPIGLVAIRGYLDSFCTVTREGAISDIVGFNVLTPDGNSVAFPLDKQSLAVFEAWEIINDNLPGYIIDVQQMATIVRALTHSSAFYDNKPGDQVESLHFCIKEMNQCLQIYDDITLRYCVDTKHFIETDNKGLPISNNTHEEPVTLTYEYCEVVIPELHTACTFTSPDDFDISEGEPMLLLFNPAGTNAALVPISEIEGFETITTEQNDLLERLLEPSVHEFIQSLIDDESLDSEEIDELVQNSTGIDIGAYDILFSGTIFTGNQDDSYSKNRLDNAAIYGASYDIVAIDGERQLVVVVEYEACNGSGVELGYVIPRKEFCDQFELMPQGYTEDYYDPELTSKLQQAATKARSVVHTQTFHNGTIEQQHQLLDRSIEDLDIIIQKFAPDDAHSIGCAVKGYLCIPNDLHGLIDPASLPYVHTEDNQVVTIEGDVIACGYPETDPSRRTPYDITKDFPISNGEPMVMIIDTNRGFSYFMRPEDIVSLQRVYAVDSGDDSEE